MATEQANGVAVDEEELVRFPPFTPQILMNVSVCFRIHISVSWVLNASPVAWRLLETSKDMYLSLKPP